MFWALVKFVKLGCAASVLLATVPTSAVAKTIARARIKISFILIWPFSSLMKPFSPCMGPYVCMRAVRLASISKPRILIYFFTSHYNFNLFWVVYGI